MKKEEEEKQFLKALSSMSRARVNVMFHHEVIIHLKYMYINISL